MMSLKFFLRLVLHVIIVALLVIEQPSSAHAQLGRKLRTEDWLTFTTRSTTIEKDAILLLRKDVSLDGIIIASTGAEGRQEGARGRKMLLAYDHVFSKRVVKEKKMADIEASKIISGDVGIDSMNTPRQVPKQHHMKPQGAKKDEYSKEFIEAEDEIANLMRRDYSGHSRPRKPPALRKSGSLKADEAIEVP